MVCEWIGWCALKPEGQAAWVQAVGSVLAILAACGVPYWQRRTDLRDRKTQEALVARSLGTMLLREFVSFNERISRDLNKVGTRPNEMVEIESDTIPQALWNNTERLHVLGLPGHHVLLAMNAVRLARKELYKQLLITGDESGERFVQQMTIAKSESNLAIELLETALQL